MNLFKSEDGASMVETAIALSLVLAVVFGIIDCGRALYTYHLVENAARLGARYAVVRGADCNHGTYSPDPAPCLPNNEASAMNQIEAYVQSVSPVLGSGNVTLVRSTDANYVPLWPGTAAETCPNAITPTAPFNGPGCTVQVQVKYTFQFMLPFLPNGGIPMYSTSQMVISQ